MRRLPPAPPPDHRGSTTMVEGRLRLPGGANAVWEQILQYSNLKMLLPSAEKIIIYLLYLVLVLMRGSELTE